jgi:putative addiction module killer protein
MGYEIEKTEQYETWFKEQAPKMQAQIEKRLLNIKAHEHFGHAKQLDATLSEIKFNNGIRIYFVIKIAKNKVLVLLLGGNKNGQSKDIAKAKSLLT